jgi:hypothetical protein
MSASSSEFSQEVIDLICRQTDYDTDTAAAKLREHGGDVVPVIREFMGGAKRKVTAPPSTNQKVFHEIRGMMDDAAKRHRENKESE